MAKMLGSFTVQDYSQWKSVFDSMRPVRRDFGSTGDKVFRAIDNENEVFVIIEWGTVDQAKKFGESQEIKDAMKRAGVQGDLSNMMFTE